MALVVTILILIILATVSINAVVGENGIIAKAKLAKNMHANSIESEQDAMDELLQEYANIMAEEENGGSQTPETPDEPQEPENPTVAVESVSLDITSKTLLPNETLQLTMAVSPSDATNKNVTWNSSTPSVATVDQNGLVTALSAGTTNITVTTEDGAKTASCSITVVKPIYTDNTLINIPKTTNGMTPVKYNNTTGKWEKADTTEEWYNYDSSKKEWANVVLGDATFVTENGVEVLDESKPYSQLVWIPRYAYKITTMYHTASTGAGNIEVVFIDTNNKDKNGTEYTRDTAAEYPTATAGETTGMSDFVVHPAFDYGGTKLEGFWVGKFESSNTNCDLASDENFDVTSGEAEYTGNEIMTVRANVTSWRKITIGNSFAVCLAMNNANNPYGLSSDDTVVDPHMTKNTEWGAVAYLSQSTYGKNAEVWNNSNTSYITGMAGSGLNESNESSTSVYNEGNGPQASTTGTVYGIYDMSGGNYERVAAYVNNENSFFISYGGELVTCVSKYKDVYTAYDSNGNVTTTSGQDSQQKNYEGATPANGHYGDAIYEISVSSVNPFTNSWYSDYSGFPNHYNSFFDRGGGSLKINGNGLFCFTESHGDTNSNAGFRVVVPVLK